MTRVRHKAGRLPGHSPPRKGSTVGGFGGWQPLMLAAACLLLAGYWILFYSVEALRRQALVYLLIPDELVRSWTGGDLRQVAVLDRGGILVITATIFLVAWIAGRLLMRLVDADRRLTSLERQILAIGVGMNALSLLVLAIGLAGGLGQPLWLVVALAALLLVAVWLVWRGWFILGDDGPQLQGTGAGPVAQQEASADWPGRGWLWGLLPFAVAIVWGGMLPPWDFDVREYHLQVPKEWYQQGQITFMPHNIYGNMPLGAEMPALLAMVLLGDWWLGALVGKTVIACFAPLTALALYASGQRLFGRGAGVAAALIYLSIPWVAHVSMSGLIDGVFAFYLLTSVTTMIDWTKFVREPRSSEPQPMGLGRGRLLLAGYLAGAAAACKYPAVLFVIIPLMLWASLASWPRWRWRPVAIVVLAAAVACGLWYGKNWVLAGNPTYPLLYDVFGGRTRTPDKNAQWQHHAEVPRNAAGQSYSLAQLGEAAARVGWRSEYHSPLVVPLALLGLLAGRRRAAVWQMAAFLAFVLACWWFATHRIDRFLVPVLPLAALLGGLAIMLSRHWIWRTAIGLVLVIGLLANFVFITTAAVADNRYLVSLSQLRVDAPQTEEEVSRVHAAHRYLNQAVPRGKRALLVGDARPFDLEVPVLYSTCFDDCWFERLMKGRTRAERAAVLKKLNISHGFFDWSEIRRYRRTYGFSDYVTRELVHQELVDQQALLRPVPLDLDATSGEVFEVVSD